MQILNLVLIIAIIAGVAVGLYMYIRWLNRTTEEEEYDNPYTIDHLKRGIMEIFAKQLKQNLKDMNLSRRELELKNREKQQLRSSLKEAGRGDKNAKRYIKSLIRDIIRGDKSLGINEETINNVIPFDDPRLLSTQDKFEIALHIWNKRYDEEGLTKMIDWGIGTGEFDEEGNEKHLSLCQEKFDDMGEAYYEIDADDIDMVYTEAVEEEPLSYEDKLNIVTQRIFEMYKGKGAADLLFDGTIDEIDIGVSGIPKDSYDIKVVTEANEEIKFSYESVWIVYHGKNIYFSAITMGSQQELIRVCQNIYKFNAPQALSRRNGGIVSTMKDGSRIVVTRPPFADSWACFARKFDSTPSIAPEDLFKDKNSQYVVKMMKWIIKGHLNTIVSGSQGTGKTTSLKSFLRFVPRTLTLRLQEKAFEMNLRYIYWLRNIVTFQETEGISMQEGINLQKKTNGSINVFGEIASREASDEYLQTCRVASLFGIGTHHAKTSRDLVKSFAVNGETEESVAQTINMDVHMENEGGHRFCQRITEIIPIRDRRYPSEMLEDGAVGLLDSGITSSGQDNMSKLILDTLEFEKRMTDRQVFKTVDIIKFYDGAYHVVNMPSDATLYMIEANLLTPIEKRHFREDMAMFKAHLEHIDDYAA